MPRNLRPALVSVAAFLFLGSVAWAAASAPPQTRGVTNDDIPRDDQKGPNLNFERAQLQPMEFSADGTRLYVVNSPGARLAVFDVATSEHVLDIPVGIGAVSVARRPGTEELWVVDSIASTVFVVDAFTVRITRSVRVGAQPHGIAFTPSGDRAYVTCTGADRVDVIDASSVRLVQSIDIPARQPRGIVWANGHAWVTPLLSGNNTAPYGLPSDPDSIVGVARVSGAGLNPLPDRDLLAIKTEVDPKQDALVPSLTRTGLGTVLYSVSLRPGTSELWIPATEALNAEFKGEKGFIEGQVVSNRIAVVDLQSGAAPVIVDLDALAPADQHLGTPAHVEFDASGKRAYVSAYGTDLVGVLDVQAGGALSWVGSIFLPPFQPYPGGAGPRQVRHDPAGTKLFVFHRVGNALTTIDLAGLPATGPYAVTAAKPQLLGFNPMTGRERQGRFLFNNARFSKSMTSSCGSCHVDGHTDGIVWDLSAYLDPEGTPAGLVSFPLDMKGPLVTQSCRRLAEVGPYHWRGEKHSLLEFNATFPNLLENQEGGQPSEIKDFVYVAEYMRRLCWTPNPRQSLDRDYTPEQLDGADLFMNKPVLGSMTCASCHQLPLGTSGEIVTQGTDGLLHSADVPALRGVGDKISTPFYIGGEFGERTELGTGFMHGGALATLSDAALRSDPAQPGTPVFNLTQQEADKIASFLEAFDWGLAPAAGYAATAHPGNLATFAQTELAFLEDQADRGNCDLIYIRSSHLLPGGQKLVHMTGLYDPRTHRYMQATRWSSGLTQAQLLADVVAGRPVTFLGLPLGMGRSMGIDRDMDELLDLDEVRLGCDPEEWDSDDDGFPDGWELQRNMDPAVHDASAKDTKPPALAGPAVVHWTSTNTIKLEFETTEATHVLVGYNGGTPVQRLPLGPPAFARHHDLVLDGLEPDTVYTLDLELSDPAGNVKLDSSIVAQTRALQFGPPTFVELMRLALPGSGGSTLNVLVDLRLGDPQIGAGYVVEGSLYQLFLGGRVIQLAPSVVGTSGPQGVARLQTALPPAGAPSVLIFVITSVQAPAGAPHYVPSLDKQKSAALPY